MTEIQYWFNYDDVGRPRDPGTYFAPRYNITVEISEDAFMAWSESGFMCPLPVYAVRSEMRPKDPLQYFADIPEIELPDLGPSILSKNYT